MKDFIIDNGTLTGYTGSGGNVIIPDGITSIGWRVFCGCSDLQSITMPDSVTKIGDEVFYSCKKLKNITISRNVTSIGHNAFNGCIKLKSITIPDSVTSIAWQAFEGCTSLQTIILPQSIKSIGHNAFNGCIKLQSIVIPDGVTKICLKTFSHCKNLESIVIPDSVKTIGSDAFYGCYELKKYVLAPTSQDEEQCKIIVKALDIKSLAWAFLTGNLQTNPLLEKLLKTKITAKKFREEYIPTLIQNNEASAFTVMLSLIKKMPPEEIDGYMDLSVEKGTVEITNRLIAYRQKLYSPEKIDEMREEDFEKAIGVREKTLADYRKEFKISKTSDGNYRITGYKGTNAMSCVPRQIQNIPVEIGEKAFFNCVNIERVDIEDGVTSIGKSAFSDCANLQSITIPDSVTSMGDKVFFGCKKLTIHAPEGSYAQKYAKENDIPFISIDKD